MVAPNVSSLAMKPVNDVRCAATTEGAQSPYGDEGAHVSAQQYVWPEVRQQGRADPWHHNAECRCRERTPGGWRTRLMPGQCWHGGAARQARSKYLRPRRCEKTSGSLNTRKNAKWMRWLQMPVHLADALTLSPVGGPLLRSFTALAGKRRVQTLPRESPLLAVIDYRRARGAGDFDGQGRHLAARRHSPRGRVLEA
jgi:hypothetical protein